MKKLILAIIALAAVATGIWAYVARPAGHEQTEFRFGQVTRGDVENLVSGTGTMSAVGTVEVGTQVSGAIAQLLADYNDRVRAGQLLAVLDTSALAASVVDAEAGCARARAQLAQAVDQYDRQLPLADRGYVSQVELHGLATEVETARASLQSAEAALSRARSSLQHAEIRAPIDGTVIQRSVEAGQTVAASLQAPTLFIIAKDLARMEILALVDESDIGQIREGQQVRFTVQAHPDRSFSGTVRQIRLQPQTVQNVVNYTVVVEATNEDGLLLPGMTASVDFLVERAQNVLRVPVAALRYQPGDQALAELKARAAARLGSEVKTASVGAGDSAREAASATGRAAQDNGNIGRLWCVDASGGLSAIAVRVGVSDGLLTEVSPDPRAGGTGTVELAEGVSVVTGLATDATATTSSTTRSASSPQRMGPPPLF